MSNRELIREVREFALRRYSVDEIAHRLKLTHDLVAHIIHNKLKMHY